MAWRQRQTHGLTCTYIACIQIFVIASTWLSEDLSYGGKIALVMIHKAATITNGFSNTRVGGAVGGDESSRMGAGSIVLPAPEGTEKHRPLTEGTKKPRIFAFANKHIVNRRGTPSASRS